MANHDSISAPPSLKISHGPSIPEGSGFLVRARLSGPFGSIDLAPIFSSVERPTAAELRSNALRSIVDSTPAAHLLRSCIECADVEPATSSPFSVVVEKWLDAVRAANDPAADESDIDRLTGVVVSLEPTINLGQSNNPATKSAVVVRLDYFDERLNVALDDVHLTPNQVRALHDSLCAGGIYTAPQTIAELCAPKSGA